MPQNDKSPPKPETESLKPKTPPDSSSPSPISTTQLFLLVLIGSIAFNAFIQWKKTGTGTGKTSGEAELLSTAEGKVKSLEEDLKKANELLELIKKDQVEVEKMFSISKIIETAGSSKPVIRFATNSTRADQIVTIATAVLAQPFYSCQKNIPVEKYDEYKNCFRDLAIEVHNRLERKLPECHFFVAAGRVHYSFMITTMRSVRAEYFISFGEVLFEVLEYSQLISDAKKEEEVPEGVPEGVPEAAPEAAPESAPEKASQAKKQHKTAV